MSTRPLIPNTDEAVSFLHRLQPLGPHHLVSINEASKVDAHNFELGERELMSAWINKHQGISNLYFHVNELKETLRNTKAKKDDVQKAICLHVDVDDIDALDRIRAYSPPPTVILFSGGGFQAFWRLQTPSFELSAVERRNQQIARDLGGDNCHNIDRIMRLPGTINMPNKKKRNVGRKAALAYVVADATDWSSQYSLEAFANPPSELTSIAEVDEAQIRNDVRVDELPEKLPPATLAIIMTGDDPDRPRGSANAHFLSRSEAVYRVACDLIKTGATLEFVASVLLSPAFGISASTLERSDAKQYAIRQATSAGEAVGLSWPDLTRGGTPRSSYRNTVIAIRRLHLSGAFDQFHQRKTLGGKMLQVFQGDLSDDLCAMLRALIIEKFDFDPGKMNAIEATNYICIENTYHPIRDYLVTLKWDDTERLDRWLIDYFGAEDTQLNRAVSRKVLVAAVRRIREPGAKFDTILVLEGPQGSGKSTAIRILAGDDNFSDQDILALDAKQQMEAMEGVWIYEIGELAGLNRGEINKVKAFASRQVDRGRPAYARFREDRPRQTIFIGTTNDDKYLRDPTGNRRFWPVLTTQIDLGALKANRDQLWAEAAQAEKSGEELTLAAELWDAAAAIQEDRMEEHPWLDALTGVTGDIIDDKARVATQSVFWHLNIDPERRQPFQLKLIATLMKQLGWTPTKFREGHQTVRGYERDTTQQDRDARILGKRRGG